MRIFGAAGIAEDVKSLLLPKVMLGTVRASELALLFWIWNR